MTKTTISIISIIVVVGALAIGVLLLKAPSSPTTNLPAGKSALTSEKEAAVDKEVEALEKHPDTTSAINKDLQELEIGDLDKEFKDIDKDLGGL